VISTCAIRSLEILREEIPINSYKPYYGPVLKLIDDVGETFINWVIRHKRRLLILSLVTLFSYIAGGTYCLWSFGISQPTTALKLDVGMLIQNVAELAFISPYYQRKLANDFNLDATADDLLIWRQQKDSGSVSYMHKELLDLYDDVQVWGDWTAAVGLLLPILYFCFQFVELYRSDAPRRALKRQMTVTLQPGGIHILIDNVPLPEGKFAEPHILLTGRTGVGKTTQLHHLIRQLRQQNVSGLFVDYQGELMRRHARTGDYVFNPFCKRGFRYSFLADARNELEREAVAASVFPLGEDEIHNYFQTTGAQIFVETMRVSSNNLDILKILNDKQTRDNKLVNSLAQVFTSADPRVADSHLTTLMARLKSLSYFPAGAGNNEDTYGLRDFVEETAHAPGPVCWLEVPEAVRHALNPMISVCCGIIITQVLSLPPRGGPPFVLVTDELGVIDTINDFALALTNGRKAKLFVVSACQHVAQIQHRYPSQFQEILSSFGTKVILGQGDWDSAKYWSDELGEVEIREWLRTKSSTHSVQGGTLADGATEHVRVRPRVLPHELRELPKFEGYLVIGPHQAVRIKIPPADGLPIAIAETFLPRVPGEGEPTAAEALAEGFRQEKAGDIDFSWDDNDKK